LSKDREKRKANRFLKEAPVMWNLFQHPYAGKSGIGLQNAGSTPVRSEYLVRCRNKFGITSFLTFGQLLYFKPYAFCFLQRKHFHYLQKLFVNVSLLFNGMLKGGIGNFVMDYTDHFIAAAIQ